MMYNRDFNRPNNCGINSPCENCKNRTMTCDTECKLYLNYKERIKELRAAEKSVKRRNQIGYQSDNMDRRKYK